MEKYNLTKEWAECNDFTREETEEEQEGAKTIQNILKKIEEANREQVIKHSVRTKSSCNYCNHISFNVITVITLVSM